MAEYLAGLGAPDFPEPGDMEEQDQTDDDTAEETIKTKKDVNTEDVELIIAAETEHRAKRRWWGNKYKDNK